jgi:lipid A 3-O-deacylase
MRKLLVLAACLLVTATAYGQWREGQTELGVLTGGGPAITGGAGDRGFWLAGFRWGRQLTAERGQGWMRGHVEYAIEAIPLYFQFQSTTVYGAGFTPFLLRYQLTSYHAIAPFVEIGAGILGTTSDVPEGTSSFNFTPQGGIGVQTAPAGRASWTFGLRYHHTSNAGISHPNPGINAIMLYTAVSWFR